MDKKQALSVLQEAITKVQELYELDDQSLAERIGVDPAYISRVKSCQQFPGEKFLSGLIREFKELRLAVLDYMATNKVDDPEEERHS